MASTRIFVRSLPPSVNDNDFRAHFGARYNVTDVKLFPARRIGYVGFKTAAEAAAAVKYFDKSFMRMSRLRVELAETPRVFKDGSLKRKHEDSKEVQHTRKSTRSHPPEADEEHAVDSTHLPFAKELVKDTAEEGLDKGTSEPELVTNKSPAESEENATEPPQSDQDWIRSRTSRLLGLVDDDEGVVTQERPEAGTEDEVEKEDKSEQHREMSGQDAQQDQELEQDSFLSEIASSKRLFLRNLPYSVTEDEIADAFSVFGKLDEGQLTTDVNLEVYFSRCIDLNTQSPCNSFLNQVNEQVQLPQDYKTGNPKGFAFVTFHDAQSAINAYQELDGTSFQGRLLHILPGSNRPGTDPEPDASSLPIKQQRQAQRKSDATRSFNWNSMYLNADAVVASVANRLGVLKSDILDPTSSDAAVRQAQAETHVIQDTKKYFSAQGVNIDAFKSSAKSATSILVKNFAYGTTVDQLRDMFATHGEVARVLMPPSGAIAIVEMKYAPQASAAFGALAYRKYQDSVLFLEKAPRDIFGVQVVSAPTQAPVNDAPATSSTLFVRNISFDTSASKFRETFAALAGFVSARIKTKTDPKRSGEVLSMGFGFLEFETVETAKSARLAMDGFSLDGHRLLIRESDKKHDAESQKLANHAQKQKARKSKIVIKNLPFEATKKDVRALFMTYGKLRAVRVPKKFDNSRKGYAFAEFTTPREAESAMEALRDTHLLGRRLVLEFAAGEADDPETEIARMQEKVGRQVNSMALQQLASTSERRKFVQSEEV